jgi:hypothetical protein
MLLLKSQMRQFENDHEPENLVVVKDVGTTSVV